MFDCWFLYLTFMHSMNSKYRTIRGDSFMCLPINFLHYIVECRNHRRRLSLALMVVIVTGWHTLLFGTLAFSIIFPCEHENMNELHEAHEHPSIITCNHEKKSFRFMIKLMSLMWELFFFWSIDIFFKQIGFLFSIGIDVTRLTLKSMFTVQQRKPDSKAKLNIFNNKFIVTICPQFNFGSK